MRANEFIGEQVTPTELTHLKHYLVDTFSSLGLDFRFGQHFYERVNDLRNGKPITIGELTRLFTRTLRRYGKQITDMPPNIEVVLRDLATKINVPIAITPEDDEDAQTIVAKTVMRKKDFGTSNPVLAIEQKGNTNVTETTGTAPSSAKGRLFDQIESSAERKGGQKEIINELGNASYSYHKVEDGVYSAYLNNGQKLVLQLIKQIIDQFGNIGVLIEFTVDGKWGLEGSGDAFRVFATVLDILQKELPAVLRQRRTTEIYFSAASADPSRVSLYTRGVPKITEIINSSTNDQWKFEKTDYNHITEYAWIKNESE